MVTKQLEQIINPIYQVGGSVRDELIGLTPKDYDYATPLSPDEIETAIRAAGKKPYLIGKRFGTVGVMIEGQMVEITTFRSEQYTPKSRKPNVEFVKDIVQDLSRRDFTVNSMAKRGYKLIDPFKGMDDARDGIIRCVGNPRERYREDPLRMLRAARFASQLNFTIEENTEKKVTEMAYKILEVSKERWVMELDKLLMSNFPNLGLDFLMRTRLLNFMIPELSLQLGYCQNSPYHKMELWEHTVTVVCNVERNINIRWGALLHDVAKPFTRTNKADRSNYIMHELLGADMVERIGRHLKWSNDRIKTVKHLVLTHMEETNPMRQADFIGKRKETDA